MKNLIKIIKVTFIFLSLILFSCQDEQIELIDTLSTATDELSLKKGGKSVVYFLVSLNPLDLIGDDVLVTIGCTGVSASKGNYPVIWFSEICLVDVDTGENTLSVLNIGVDSTDYTVIMGDGNGGHFRAFIEEGPEIGELTNTTHRVDLSDLGPFKVWKRVGKGKHVSWVDTYGTIQIGEIVFEPTPDKPL